MPHVIVKLLAGRSEPQKARLAEATCAAVVSALGAPESAVSVAIEDIAPEDWTEKVWRPDILGKPDQIYKKPGYDPLK